MTPALARGLVLFVCLPASFAWGADWPQFRGPGGLARSLEAGLPVSWSDDENIIWTTELPGYGASSPITLGDRVYLTCYTGYGLGVESPGTMDELARYVLCLEAADGQVVWSRPVETLLPEEPYQGFQSLHGYASSTPATDGERLYVFFGKSGLFAFDLEGRQLWRADVGSRIHNWGSGTSPVLFRDLVIVNASVESGSLVAVDKRTGREAWRAGGMDASWNTPLLVDVPGGETELVVSVRGRLLGFDPATGDELWSCASIDDYVCPSVVAHEGIVYAIGGRSKPGLAVRAGGRGDVTSQRLWQTSKGSNVSSPVYHEGYLYWANESGGTVYSVNAETGELVYQQRLEPRPDLIYASPIVADGKLYYVSRDRGTYVLAARPEFEQLGHNRLESDTSIFNGSPAVAPGRLLLRSDRFLYAIGRK